METAFLERPDRPPLAYVRTNGRTDLPTVIFLGGFRSDMQGTKATFLEERCKARAQSYIRFDYSGHGESGGEFEDGTITGWADDAADIIQSLTEGPLVLVGSSMGGWISLLLALRYPSKVIGLVGLAAAPDFTREMAADIDDDQRRMLEEKGYFELENDYSDEPYIITRKLVEDGNSNLLLDKDIVLDIPVRIIQGMKDADVEWQTAHRIKNAITGEDVEVCLIEDGDHRLSGEKELELIDRMVCAVSGIA